MKKIFQHFKRYLKQKKLKLTKQRAAIAAMFLDKKGHLCVDELYYRLRKKYPRIGYTTVYRTMKILEKAKMASGVNFTGKRKRFEYSFDRQHHDHFVCQECGRVIEFFDPEIEKRQEFLCDKYKFESDRHQMQIFGICAGCKKKGD